MHAAGGLCSYDQANANGILGVTRAREAGFDLCQFNLHNTFSIPHACGWPGSGSIGVTNELAKFLPTPTVEFDGTKYFLDWDRLHSIGKVAHFHGCASNVVRAYTWVRNLGPEGLREVTRVAVLNNNEYVDVTRQVASEAYSGPEKVKRAPHNNTIHRMDNYDVLEDPERWAITWRAYLRKVTARKMAGSKNGGE